MSCQMLITVVISFCYLLGSLAWAVEAPAGQRVLFARDIQPLFAKHCLLCHGPDEAEAGLRLDLADAAYAELDSGERAIVPGDADASELVARVTTTDESLQMPPDGDPLSEVEVDQLRQWIADGAEYKGHWAYQPIVAPAVPAVSNTAWIRNSIDHFVLANLERQDILPSPAAGRATLIKRLHYDLVGLPPTPQEVDAFVANDAPNAYEQLIDRLLESEHFGERWGRHWLDMARYADSDGYEKDKSRPNAWRYRDWVIQAINRDVPYDTFTIEQLAGDLLPDASPEQHLATAFHRQTLTNTEGGTDQEEFRVEATFDRTETTGAIWMALTFTCARCHSHKYDQIPQKEYYQLFAFFNNVDETTSKVPRSSEVMAKHERDMQAYNARVAELEVDYETAKKRLQPKIDAWLEEMATALDSANNTPLEFQLVQPLEAKATSKATLTFLPDKSLLASGPIPDKDKYTLVLQAPEAPVTGFRIELLTHDSLGKNGPGRTAHGNFVLSQLRAYVSDSRNFEEHSPIELAAAESDFAQDGFAPQGALSAEKRSGWAIAPQMSKDHQITVYTPRPLALKSDQFVQIVLDQQYGGKHTIGRFRVATMSGSAPLKAVPKQVADAVAIKAGQRTDKHRRIIADYVATRSPETATLAHRLAQLKSKAPESPLMSVRVLGPANRTTHILHRGDFLQPADEVAATTPNVINDTHPLRPRNGDVPADRLDLATWLVDCRHPLTPRVTVNQVWAHLFGHGLVPSLNDFGVRGEMPTHPQLLDYLAWHFSRDMQWSRKKLIKTIAMSATYRQSSHYRRDLQASDPLNRLLARQNRVRVEAELVRDLYLAVSGLLSREIGGPSVFPPLPPGVAELSYANNFKWKTSEGDDRYRRGMYTFFKRTSPHPTLISFDCPDSNTSRISRETSNTPLQALATLNNDVFAEAAQAMARRVLTEGGTEDNERLTYALRLCIARRPAMEGIEHFRHLLLAARDHYRSHPEDAAQLTNRHAVENTPTEENAAWIATLRMVLNLDEFIVRD